MQRQESCALPHTGSRLGSYEQESGLLINLNRCVPSLPPQHWKRPQRVSAPRIATLLYRRYDDAFSTADSDTDDNTVLSALITMMINYSPSVFTNVI